MGQRITTFHDRQLVGESGMNMIVADLTELYDEWLKDGDVLAEGADGDHGLIPTPITLRSVPLRSGFDCFEDDAGNLTYVAGEPGRADWIFPPKYQREPWSEGYFISDPTEGVWSAIAYPQHEKYPPGPWSGTYGYDDSGWMDGVAASTRHYYQEWLDKHGPDFIAHGAQVINSEDYHQDMRDMGGWHRLMRRKFTVSVPADTEIARAELRVWSDNYTWWYLNGTEVAHYRRGASSGPFDITSLITTGNNLLAAQLTNDPGDGVNPMGLKFIIIITYRPTTALGEQFYLYWAQITGDPDDSPHNAFCIAGTHGISGHEYGNGARFYTYDHHHGKVNNVWINAFCLGQFE